MAGERLLENGDRRVTESLDVRITEGVRFGISALTTTGTLAAAGLVTKDGAAAFTSAVSSITATGTSGIVSAISLLSTSSA